MSDKERIGPDQFDQNLPLFLKVAYAINNRRRKFEQDYRDTIAVCEWEIEQSVMAKGNGGYPVFLQGNKLYGDLPYAEVRVQDWNGPIDSIGYLDRITFDVVVPDGFAKAVIKPMFYGFPDFSIEVWLKVKKEWDASHPMYNEQLKGKTYKDNQYAYSCSDYYTNGYSEASEIAEVLGKALAGPAYKRDLPMEDLEDFYQDYYDEDEHPNHKVEKFSDWKARRYGDA